MPKPEIVRVSEEFRKKLLAMEAEQMAVMAREWIGVQDRLKDRIEALVNEIKSKSGLGADEARRYLMQSRQYQKLIAQIRNEIAKYSNYADNQIMAKQLTFYDLGLADASVAIETMTGLNMSFGNINKEAFRAMVGFTREGTPLNALLMRSWPDSVEGLTNALLDGISQGWNPTKTAKAMMEGIDTGLDRIFRIAQMEQMRAYRKATVDSYRESNVVTGYKRLAAKNNRTCIACIASDGEVFDLLTDFYDHIGGHCVPVPIVKNIEEPRWKTGAEWFEGLPDERQQKIMGVNRWEGWKEGKFNLNDLVKMSHNDIWGDSLGIRPMKDLMND